MGNFKKVLIIVILGAILFLVYTLVIHKINYGDNNFFFTNKVSVTNYAYLRENKIFRCGVCLNGDCRNQFAIRASKLLISETKRGMNSLEWHSKNLILQRLLYFFNNEDILLDLYLSNVIDKEGKGIESMCFSKFKRKCNNLGSDEIRDVLVSLYVPVPILRTSVSQKIAQAINEKCLHLQ